MPAEALQRTPTPSRQQAIETLARSLFREMKAHGYDPQHVISLTSELLQLVTDDVKASAPPPHLEVVTD